MPCIRPCSSYPAFCDSGLVDERFKSDKALLALMCGSEAISSALGCLFITFVVGLMRGSDSEGVIKWIGAVKPVNDGYQGYKQIFVIARLRN